MSNESWKWARPSHSLAGALVLGLLAPLTTAATPDTAVVETVNGSVRGKVKTNYSEWLGIPYAKPPVGALRWKAPEPAESWSGVRDATKPGSSCVQGTGWDPGYEEPHLNEDCLSLNIYSPHDASEDNLLPVFFWIHGGGLRGGAGYDVDPRKFVNQGNVVFVTHNYRLGALGFLAVPGLAKEDPDAVGNYGMLDQQAALRWVHENISKFGGDPDQITIAGQSAGARSVCNHLASPTTKGLFARAVHQSGGCDGISVEEAEKDGERFAEAIGCTDPATAAECLRGKSPAQILAAQDAVRISSTVYGGNHFPIHPAEAIRTGRFNQVPVLIGQVRDERTQSLFAQHDYVGSPLTMNQYRDEVKARYGMNAYEVLERYPVTDYWSPTVALANVAGDERACQRVANPVALSAHVPSYAYEFDERDPPAFVSIWRLHSDFPFGATHVNELGYLFEYLGQALPFSSAQGELSDQMVNYWTNFVKTGDPNGKTLPHWPRYSPETGKMMSLKASGSKAKSSFRDEHRCDFWESLGK